MGNAESSGEEKEAEVERKNSRKASRTASSNSARKMSQLQSINRMKSFELSPIQLKQIQKLWAGLKHTKGPHYAGEMIFSKIFVKSPSAKDLFLARGVSGPSEYRVHFIKFSETLDYVVENLGDLEIVSNKLVELGKFHVKMRGRGFDPSLWDVFAEAMISCTLMWGEKSQRNNSTQEAWTKIVLFIIDRMREGYQLELRTHPYQSPVSGVSPMQF